MLRDANSYRGRQVCGLGFAPVIVPIAAKAITPFLEPTGTFVGGVRVGPGVAPAAAVKMIQQRMADRAAALAAARAIAIPVNGSSPVSRVPAGAISATGAPISSPMAWGPIPVPSSQRTPLTAAGGFTPSGTIKSSPGSSAQNPLDAGGKFPFWLIPVGIMVLLKSGL